MWIYKIIRLIKIIISVTLLCVVIGLVYRHIEKKVTRFDLPEGELKWAPVRPLYIWGFFTKHKLNWIYI